MGSWANAAQSSKSQTGGQSRASAKDSGKDDKAEVIEIGKTDFKVETSDDGEAVTVTLADQVYSLDLETGAELAEQLVDANPNLEKTEQD